MSKAQKASTRPSAAPDHRRIPAWKTVLRIAVCAGLAAAFAFAWVSFYRTTPVVTESTGDYLPRHLHQGAVVEQPFTTSQGRLGSVSLSFERGVPAAEAGEVAIRVRIFRGTDAAGAEPLFETILASGDIMSYADTVVPVRSVRVAPGTPLRLEITALEVSDTAMLSIRTVGSMEGGLVEDGVARRTLDLYTVESYVSFDTVRFAICVVLAVLVLLIAFDVIRPLDRWAARARFWPLFIYAFLVIVVIELLNTLNTDLLLAPVVLVFTYLIALGITFFLFFLVRSVPLTILLSDILLITLATVNHSKIYFRGDPLYIGDLLLAGEAVTSLKDLHFQVSVRMLMAILVLLITLLAFRMDAWRPRRSWRMPAAALAVAAVLSGFVGLVVCNDAVMQDGLGINRYTWNQMTNYKKNGFLLSFSASIANLSVETPEYNQPELAGLYDVPPPAADEPDIAAKPHIIAIMSESYTDFRNVRDIPVSEPVTPFYDSLMTRDNIISGNLLVSIFGGGTCNTEFEYLTGGSMLFLQDGIIPYGSYMKRPTHSVPALLNAQGYRSVAVHPYIRTFWDRDTVYPNLGFDKFISMEGFEDPEIIRTFISDRSCFEKVIEEFEATPDDERLFLYAVTMQNHFPYYVDEDQLTGLKYRIDLNGLTGMESAEMYLSLLRQSDDALRELVEYFEEQDEPVILVFFGDHLPGNNQELMPFYNYLFGGEIANLNIVETRKMFETPFFIWSNTVDLPEDNVDIISPNLLGTYVLDLAGARMSPYFEFVNELRGSVSAINSKTILDAEERSYDRTSLSRELETLMNRYWVYEYDSIVKP